MSEIKILSADQVAEMEERQFYPVLFPPFVHVMDSQAITRVEIIREARGGWSISMDV